MKKCFALMWTMLLVGLLGLCAGCSESPKKVVGKWQQAVTNGNVAEAKLYCVSSSEAADVTSSVGQACKAKSDELDQDVKKQIADLKNNAPANEKITGDNATVTIGNWSIFLKKVNGKWLVKDFDYE